MAVWIKMYRGKLSVGRTLHYSRPNSSKACGQGLYYNHEDLLQFFSFSGYHRKNKTTNQMFWKMECPLDWAFHCLKCPHKQKRKNMFCNVPSNYSKQIGASLCVQVVAQHVPYLPTLVRKHLHTSNPYIHLHSRERGK